MKHISRPNFWTTGELRKVNDLEVRSGLNFAYFKVKSVDSDISTKFNQMLLKFGGNLVCNVLSSSWPFDPGPMGILDLAAILKWKKINMGDVI